MFDDQYFMNEALKEAQKALEEGEMPVGAVVVCGGKIVARAHNQVEKLRDATAHAEMLALTAAMNALGAKYLNDCTLYVTLEPCQMCAGALFWSKIKRIVYAAPDPKLGFEHLGCRVHPKTRIEKGIQKESSLLLIQDFFSKTRN